jgi:hypothetical protein
MTREWPRSAQTRQRQEQRREEPKPKHAHMGLDLVRPPCHRHHRPVTRSSMTAATPRHCLREPQQDTADVLPGCRPRRVYRRRHAAGSLPNSASRGGSEEGERMREGARGPLAAAQGRRGAARGRGRVALHAVPTMAIAKKLGRKRGRVHLPEHTTTDRWADSKHFL